VSSAAARGAGDLSIRGIAREAVVLYLRHWKVLAPLAVVILLPQAVIGTYVGDIEIERVQTAGDVLKLIAVPATALVSLGGEALLAGMITALVLQWRAGHRPPEPRLFLKSLLWVRLISLDLLLAFGAAVGFLLLVVPGLVFLTYFATAPAFVEMERRRAVDALRRSASLVRGHFRRVFVLIVGALVVTEGLAELLVLVLHGFAPEVASEVLVDALLESTQGLIVALLAITLLQLRGERIPAHPATRT
jgi:hypothetical protein